MIWRAGNTRSGCPSARSPDHIRVKDAEMLKGAMSFAAQNGWLMVRGQPVHSVLLTQSGQAAALKK